MATSSSRALTELVLLLACGACAWPAELVIAHVAVVDVAAGRVRPEMTVVISGERISAVAESRIARIPSGARVVDARGKFLIPGLWDMHTHVRGSWDPEGPDDAGRTFYSPYFVAAGITGVRSMWDVPANIRRLRAEIDSGRVAGPRIVSPGPMLDGPAGFLPGVIRCATAEEGRQGVELVRREGADFVKVYSYLTREAYFAIAKEARRVGLPFAGHVPNSVTAAEASDAGQKSMEHLIGVSEISPPLFAKFVKNGTWQCPTLAALRSVARFGDPEYRNDDRLADLPPAILKLWKSGGPGMNPDEDLGVRRQRFEAQLKIVGAMERAGVGIMAGTDTPNPYVFPGSSLHD